MRKATSRSNPLLEAALKYAARGWYVHPCYEGPVIMSKGTYKEKSPRTKWVAEATTDPERIKEWWTRWPNALIGIATGPSKLFVMDVDVKKGHKGLESYKKLGIKSKTMTQSTPSGGFHKVHEAGDTEVASESNGKTLGEGVDIRAQGGYFIAAPSVVLEGEHPGAYVITDPREPSDIPEAIKKLLLVKTRTTKPTAPLPKLNVAEMVELLESLSQKRWEDHDDWITVGMILHDWDEVEGLELWDKYSKLSKKYKKNECKETWSNFNKDKSNKVTVGTLRAWVGEDAPILTVKEKMNQRSVSIQDAKYFLKERPPVEQVVSGMISRGSVTVLVGSYDTKKTWCMLHLAASVAMGKPWVGHDVTKGNTLIVDEETGRDMMARRMYSVLHGLKGDETTKVYSTSLNQFNLLKSSEDAELLERIIKEGGATLVIFDALVDFMAGGDENAVKDTQPVFIRLRRIAENTRAALVLIHHSNKGGLYRGSTAIPGAIDNMIGIASDDNSNMVYFKSLKVRDARLYDFEAEAAWVDGTFTMGVPSSGALRAARKSSSPVQAWILQLLLDGPRSTPSIIKEATKKKHARKAVLSALDTLKNRNEIEVIRGGGRGSSVTWQLLEGEEVRCDPVKE